MDEQTTIPPTPAEEVKPEEHLTMRDAARISGYQQDYLGQMARAGKLKAFKSGNNWITTKSELDAYIAKHSRKRTVIEEMKPKIIDVVVNASQPVEATIKSMIDPSAPHPMHTSVSDEPLTHAPTIPLNV